MTHSTSKNAASSRRDFIRQSGLLVAGGAIAGQLSVARSAHAAGSDTIKLGLIGCGGRGTGAAVQAMNTSGGDVKLVAMADVAENNVQQAFRTINGAHKTKVDVPKERMFVGLDAYEKVLGTDCDLVILATPPGFRPTHFEAAINAGKNVFMEKPVAADVNGVNQVLKATQEAKKKNLAVAVGLQRRHERKYMETVAKIQEGAIGDIILARAYWNGSRPWLRQRKEGMTELQYQINNWYYFNWLSGDHINEQHIHNLDVINWIKNAYPVSAQGMGGLVNQNEVKHGEIFDHHFVEFMYGDGTILYSQCRHQPGCWNSVSEHVHGTKGRADVSGSKIYDEGGKILHDFGKLGGDGHQQEHHDLFADLRAGRVPNEGEWGAKSTMTAILGRMATYSGQVVKWDEALKESSKLADYAKLATFMDEAPVKPLDNGTYLQPVPGKGRVTFSLPGAKS
jgi:myo-inositol 2-dehydrogenase/D-chiro-inositol 1-dehydrogenase